MAGMVVLYGRSNQPTLATVPQIILLTSSNMIRTSTRANSRQNAERFIGQRRGAGFLGWTEKIVRRDGELKTYWTEPAGLAGELLYGR